MINVICLKHGTKYSSDYVNRLYYMVKRHLTLPHKFYCFTEDTSEIDSNIIIKPLPNNTLKGWWWTPYIFKKGQFDSGDVNLFLDLDTVIIKNIDKFFLNTWRLFVSFVIRSKCLCIGNILYNVECY